MFSAGHEPTQGIAFGAARGARAHSKQCFRCGARAHPNRPLGSAKRECAARMSLGGRNRYPQLGWRSSTHVVEVCKPPAVAPRRSLWRVGQKVGVAVGAAFAVLECAIERDDELKLPKDSCITSPQLDNALPFLVAGEYAERVPPKYPRRRLGAPTMLPGKFRGVQCISESSVPRLIHAIRIGNETSSRVTVPPMKQGPWSDSEVSVPTPEANSTPSTFTAFSRPARLRNSPKTPKEDLCERWPLLTARPRP